MKMSEALHKISLAYIPGTVRFYEKHNPDPWQAALDELEKSYSIDDPMIIEASIDAFCNRCLELIEAFKKTNIRAEQIEPIDAFHLGERYREFASRKYKHCIKCQTTEGNLKIIASKDDPTSVVIICSECYGGKQK